LNRRRLVVACAPGGIFVAVLAPGLFRGYWELGLGLWVSALLLFLVLAREWYARVPYVADSRDSVSGNRNYFGGLQDGYTVRRLTVPQK